MNKFLLNIFYIIFNTVLNGDNELALTLDSNKLATFAGAITTASTIAAGSTIHRGNMTIDSQEIDVGSGDLLIDVAGQLNLDAGNSEIHLKGAGTVFGKLFKSGGNFYINHPTSDADIYITGNDGGSSVQAAKFDMSEGGTLTLGGGVDGIDYSVTFDGNAADGVITWM